MFFCLFLASGEQLATELGCSYLEVAAAEQVQPTCAVFHEVCREVLALRRRGKQSLLDRMLASAKSSSKAASGGAGPRTYLRGKSDSALPWTDICAVEQPFYDVTQSLKVDKNVFICAQRRTKNALNDWI